MSVADIARENAVAAGLSDRVDARGGDFFEDSELPAGYDVHLFSMSMRDWTDEHDRALLAKSYQALEAGGTIVISELLVNDHKTGPAPAALMSLNMLIETEGRNYTPAQYTSWLEHTGFRDVRTIRFDAPGASGAILATKPKRANSPPDWTSRMGEDRHANPKGTTCRRQRR